ncbi:MAG: hypothetical protein IPL51_18005 [Candidatus Competibacteraceae bacterium]|nr:hypothetical protein [Candidatus Competibacteraceae bacterium]
MIDDNPRNEDPISGEAGAHPVGTGVGAAGGAMAGAAVGSVVGPIGTAIGAVVGAVVGGLAGKGAAEAVNPTVEDEDLYWRGAYATRPGYQTGYSYDDDYAPAYRLGYAGRGRYQGSYEEHERELAAEWENIKGKSRLTWEQAKVAARDAWDHFEGTVDDVVGDHPVATGAGATGGALAGAAIGSVAGPIGTAVGAAIGAATGGLAGKGAGEVVNPKATDDRSDHKLATGVGAGAGAATGAALGAVGGPVGMAVGAAIGAAGGGLAGEGAGEVVNPKAGDELRIITWPRAPEWARARPPARRSARRSAVRSALWPARRSARLPEARRVTTRLKSSIRPLRIGTGAIVTPPVPVMSAVIRMTTTTRPPIAWATMRAAESKARLTKPNAISRSSGSASRVSRA